MLQVGGLLLLFRCQLSHIWHAHVIRRCLHCTTAVIFLSDGAYIADRGTGALNGFGPERDISEFDKCKQNVWQTIRWKTLEDK